MNSPRNFTGRSAAATVRIFLWRHPEWWTFALSGLAWAVMLLQGWRSLTHGGHHRMSFAQETVNWMLMVAAMMFPLIVYPVQRVAVTSLWSRRNRAIAGFLAGYLGSWLALGLVIAALRGSSWAHTASAAALAFAAAACWQRTSWHWSAISACHRIEPLAPTGWRADRDCLRSGAVAGGACAGSCWPLMVACAFTGHSPVAMAGGMVVGLASRRFRPRTGAMLGVTLALSLYHVALAGLGASHVIAAAAPAEIVASTAAPFWIGKGETRLELPLHAPARSDFQRPGPHRKVFLNLEKMVCEIGSGPWQAYLNLPQNKPASQHPELTAGDLPMFGLREASQPGGKKEPEGIYEQLDITDLFARLPGLPGWDPKRLVVTFVPRFPGNARIRVARMTVVMSQR